MCEMYGFNHEFGDFHDNNAALEVALWKIAQGAREEGFATIALLQEHILRTQEAKSVRLLLPILAAISASAGPCQAA